MWAYTYEDEDGDAMVGLDLDHNSLLNDSEDDFNVIEELAARDIKEGEELLCSYKSFEKEGLWESLGLGNWEREGR